MACKNFKWRGYKVSLFSQTRFKISCFLHFKRKYLAVYTIKVSEISSTHFYTSLMYEPLVRYAKKELCCSLQLKWQFWVFFDGKKALVLLGLKWRTMWKFNAWLWKCSVSYNVVYPCKSIATHSRGGSLAEAWTGLVNKLWATTDSGREKKWPVTPNLILQTVGHRARHMVDNEQINDVSAS